MKEREDKDSLGELEKVIEATAKDKGFTVFKADDLSRLWSYDESGRTETTANVVEWREGESWEEFMSAAGAIGTKVLYVDARKFSWNDLVERIDDMSTLTPDEIAKRKKHAESFKKYDGCVEHVIMAFRANGVWHAYQETADWLPKYEELEEEPELVEKEERSLSEEMLERYARKLAQDESFAKLRNKGDQVSLAERLFANEGGPVLNNLNKVVSRARVLYQTEVAPEKGSKGRLR